MTQGDKRQENCKVQKLAPGEHGPLCTQQKGNDSLETLIEEKRM